MNCDPGSLLSQASCFQCLDHKQLAQIVAYLLCQIANSPTAAGVPSGTIVMWNGSIASIPTGWVLCDGTQGTPDLRDRFVIGASQDQGGIAETNVDGLWSQTGGAYVVSTIASSTVLGGFGGTDRVWNAGANSLLPGRATSDGVHAVANYLPPYFSLAYIMKL